MDPATLLSPWRPDLFDGRQVLVTGGSSGIGFGIAHAFAAHGAHVVVTGRDKDKLGRAVDTLLEHHEHVEGHCFDVRDRDSVRDIAAMLEDAWGPLDVLVNNAAGNFLSTWLGMSENAWDSVLDIVLQGTANVTRAFGAPMVAAGRQEAQTGRPKARAVINIVAGYAWTGAPGVAHSGAAKAGVLNLTKSLAAEWGHAGVRVNAIAPGAITGTGGAARLWEGGDADEATRKRRQDNLLRSVPLNRFGKVDDIGQVALFLASPAAAYVTGSCLVADGGMDAIGPFPWMGELAARLEEEGKRAPS